METFFQPQLQILEANLAWVSIKGETTLVVNPIFFSVMSKAMEVNITPAEGNLDKEVQIVNGAIARDEYAARDSRTYFEQQKMKLVNLGRRV